MDRLFTTTLGPTKLRLAALGLAATLACATFPGLAQPATPAGSGVPSVMATDLAARHPDIRWPDGFDPARAALFAHNALMVEASCAKVWTHIVDAARWPDWYPNARDVALPPGAARLGPAGVFRWTTFGFAIESRIDQHEDARRLAWYGGAPGAAPAFYHVWHLEPNGPDCRVITEEVGIGPAATHLREANAPLLHRGHDLWLATLKWVAETQ